MNEKLETKVETLRPFTRFLITIGELPTSYLMSMTYYEQILWFTKYLQEKVIPAVNNNAEAVKEIQDFLNTLDLQDEVNNKLDEMAESGQLTDIIAQYLGLAGMITFNTVADMKLAENLVEGSKCCTLGYASVGDNGQSFYRVRTITNSDVVDERTIIALYDNTLIAEIVTKGYITAEMFGATGDGTTDDSESIQIAINYASEKNIPLMLTKTYSLQNIITLKNNLTIDGYGTMLFDIDDFDFGSNIFCVLTENFDTYTLTLNQFNHDIVIKNITIEGKGGSTTIYNILGISNTINFTFNNVHILLDDGGRFEPFDFRGGNINTVIENCLIEDLQNNIKPNPAGGCIFRQYNPNYSSSFKLINNKFIKKNGDEVIFINIRNNMDSFVIDSCSFEIGIGQLLTKTPDNCLTLITYDGAIAHVIYQNCNINANTFNEHLLIMTNNDDDNLSTLTFKNCNIETSSNATGMIGQKVNFENCSIKIGNSIAAATTPQISRGNVDKCKIEILTNQSYNIFQNIEYVKDSIIIGNAKTCTALCNNVRKFINNFVDGVSFTNCFVDVQKIFNNQIYRYNEASAYNNILYFNDVTDCVCKNNYFDFWSIIDVKSGVTVWFTNNESSVRFTLTNNGTFKNANNVGDQGFVGTGWNDSGNNIVL